MFTKKSISHVFSVLFALVFMLMLVGPAHTVSASLAESARAVGVSDLPAAPLRNGTPPVSAISAGYYHMCELRSNGTIQCWGNNASLQTEVPAPNSGWVQVSAGGNHTCARKGSDTSIQCWGRNIEGQAPATPAGTDWMNVSTGAAHTCAVESDDSLYCWGFNDSGQATVPAGSDGTWEQQKFSAGGWHTCGIKIDGTLQCWGESSYGKRDVPAPNSNWVQVSAGREHTCAIKSGGAVQCWGAGITNTGINPYYGQSIPPAGNFTQISAGGYHTCGLKSDNTIACWGRNDGGQSTVPIPNENWQQVSTGDLYTCGLKTDGTLRCWGYNNFGQAPVVAIAPSSLPNGALNAAYTHNLTASGGASPYTYSLVSGALPAGLNLNANGTWSGAPTVEGVFTFTVQANDVNDVAGQQEYTLTIEGTPPTVVSITRSDSNPTGATSVNFYITFSEIVTGVDVSDFSLTTSSGVSGATVAWVVGSLTDYTVIVNTGSGSGTLRLDVTDNDSIVDSALIPLGGVGPGNGSFTSGQTYDIEKTPPTIVSILRANPDPTNAATVQFAITFSEPVNFVYASNFVLTTTGVSGASVGEVSGSGNAYTVTVLTGSDNGTIRLDVPISANIQDLAGNLLANLPYTSGDIYTVIKTNWIYLPLIMR